MAFESLTEKLQNVFKNLRSKGRLTEDDVKAALKEVKMALLEADVNYKVVKDFTAKIQEKAIGTDVLKGINPGQQFIKIVNDELVELLGGTNARLTKGVRNPTVLMLAGLQGAGKTTFIKKLLQEAISGEQVVLIENEFGEIGIDGGFLKESGIQITEMNSGCICCSLVGDFGESLKEVVDTYHPDRILIEPSGVGKLSDVIKAVQDVQDEIDAELNSFTTVVDVTKCKIYRKNFGEFFSNQIEYAGAVILSRTDKAKPEKIQESVALLRELNEKAARCG